MIPTGQFDLAGRSLRLLYNLSGFYKGCASGACVSDRIIVTARHCFPQIPFGEEATTELQPTYFGEAIAVESAEGPKKVKLSGALLIEGFGGDGVIALITEKPLTRMLLV
eukprot:5702292-Amphidinium_carterae.1